MGFLVVTKARFSPSTYRSAAKSHSHQDRLPSLLLAVAVGIGAVWLTVAVTESGQSRMDVEVTTEAGEWAGPQGETYPRRVDTDVAELFSYSGF